MMIVRITDDRNLISEDNTYIPTGNYLALQSPILDQVILINSKGDQFRVSATDFIMAFDHGILLNISNSVLA